jgi:hypothetical protein
VTRAHGPDMASHLPSFFGESAEIQLRNYTSSAGLLILSLLGIHTLVTARAKAADMHKREDAVLARARRRCDTHILNVVSKVMFRAYRRARFCFELEWLLALVLDDARCARPQMCQSLPHSSASFAPPTTRSVEPRPNRSSSKSATSRTPSPVSTDASADEFSLAQLQRRVQSKRRRQRRRHLADTVSVGSASVDAALSTSRTG